MPVLAIERIYKQQEEQQEYNRAWQRAEKQKGIFADLGVLGRFQWPRVSAIPDWIRGVAKEFDDDGFTLEETIEEARRISRKFKTALSNEVIAEREGRRA